MKRVVALIDGFNIYHSIADNTAFHKYKWLNLRKLIECFTVKGEQVTDVFYFSAYAFWKPDKVARHQIYVKALRTANVNVVMSEFKLKKRKCKECKKLYDAYEEKQTDVQIAINLFRESIDDSYEKAMIVSGDTDLIPALKAVKAKFPVKRLHVLFPPNRAINSLKQIADSYSRIREKHLASSQFPDDIVLEEGHVLSKPTEWM